MRVPSITSDTNLIRESNHGINCELHQTNTMLYLMYMIWLCIDRRCYRVIWTWRASDTQKDFTD